MGTIECPDTRMTPGLLLLLALPLLTVARVSPVPGHQLQEVVTFIAEVQEFLSTQHLLRHHRDDGHHLQHLLRHHAPLAPHWAGDRSRSLLGGGQVPCAAHQVVMMMMMMMM